MAYVKLGATKSANRLITYAEKKADVISAFNCDADFAKSQFTVTRESYGKNDKIQAHHVIQSFKPLETTPEQANKIGLELAQKLFKGHEVAIYTHIDRSHIHNHIVVNSVNFETGKKLQLHGVKALERVRGASDELCLQNKLSIPRSAEPAPVRYTLAEKSLIEKGQTSWKDELRQVIDMEKGKTTSFEDFKKNLSENYNITVTERGKNIVFKHPDNAQSVRGKTLGADYEKGAITNGIGRQIDSKRTTARLEQTKQGGTRKQLAQGEFDGVHRTIREIENRAKQLSGTGREELRAEQEAVRNEVARIEKQQRATLAGHILHGKGLGR